MKFSQLTKLIINELEELQAIELKEIDISNKSSIADKMIVCTGRSNRHVKSIGAKLVEKLKHTGQQPLSTVGMDMGEWVLVDCGDIIVHVMQAQTRAFYNLEGLWQFNAENLPANEN